MTSTSSTPSILRVPFFPARSLIRSSRSTPSSLASSTSQSRRARRTSRRRLPVSLTSPTAPVVVNMPVVDLNNNNSSSLVSAPAVPVLQLDRVAILKAFASVSQPEHSNSGVTNSSNPVAANTANRTSRYEKPTSYREARRRQLRPVSLSDPAIEQELIRLRDSVPSIAGSNASDLTIINEAISLICDLESQLIRKLKCQTLPVLPPMSS